MARFIKSVCKTWKLGLIGTVGILLAACNSDVTTSNTVAGTTTASSFSTGAGTSLNVPMTFNTSTGSATQLTITNQSSFPANWSIPGATTCQTITNGGTDCQINLVYSPTEPAAASSFTINYSYYSSDGTIKTGTATINYSATTNAPGYSYTTSSNGNLYSCAVNSSGSGTNGNFSGCTATPASSAPWNTLAPPTGIAFATSSGTTYAYVAASVPGTDGNMYSCTVTNGVFSNCAVTPPGGVLGWVPNDVATATVNGSPYAYVTSLVLGVGSVFQCTINASTGAFGTCSLQAGPLWAANAITLGTAGGSTYAYVADSTNKKVYQCSLNSTGGLTSCAASSGTGAPPAWTPSGINIATVSGTTYAYVADTAGGNIYQCSIGSNGALSNCNVTAPGSPASWTPTSINIRSIAGTTYAYVTATVLGIFHEVYQCSLNTNGTLNTCSATPTVNPGWTPTNLGLN